MIAGVAIVKADPATANRGAVAHLVVKARRKRRWILRTLTWELNRTGLIIAVLREFQRVGIKPGAAVGINTSWQGARVGQCGAEQGLGRNAVGGRPCATDSRNGNGCGNSGQRWIAGGAAKDGCT